MVKTSALLLLLVRILVLSTVILFVWGEVGLTITAESDINVASYNIVINRIDSFGDINKAHGHWGWHIKMLLSVPKSCFSPLPKSYLCLIKPISLSEENIGCGNK
jgi:16S rRNA A1518/A1519 N6-dimethyltransferase RsmA/KsgA/DIM1 with predicted DNA glycosylase/AP lyase activity